MAKAFFTVKLREKLAQRESQIQSVTELTDKLKPECLLKTLVLRLFANKLVTLIIMALGSVSTSSHSTVSKGKKCNSNIPILGSGYSKEGNIQKLKARSPLREVVPNINMTFTELPLKLCGRPRKINA